MRNLLITLLAGILLLAALTSCSRSEAGLDAAAHRADVLAWREGRLERLLAPTGYLNQTGLYWLDPGSYRFGTAEDNDVVLSGEGEPYIGSFQVNDSGVTMTALSGIQVHYNGEPIDSIMIASDLADEPVMITHGSLAWSVVERMGRFAIRLRDFEHPFVAGFGPLKYFEIDPSRRVTATLRRYDEPVMANVATVIEGLGYHPESPGVVEFTLDGEVHQLEAYASGEQLFFVFGDLTNRDDTYGAGRFLYAENPGADGQTILDFNQSYSPPCAFNDFSTCPVASPRNRLGIRVEAGELYDERLHYSTEP